MPFRRVNSLLVFRRVVQLVVFSPKGLGSSIFFLPQTKPEQKKNSAQMTQFSAGTFPVTLRYIFSGGTNDFLAVFLLVDATSSCFWVAKIVAEWLKKISGWWRKVDPTFFFGDDLITLLGTNIFPSQGTFEDDVPFPFGGICCFPGG